jgi:Domain of Unknown Function (DUF1080)
METRMIDFPRFPTGLGVRRASAICALAGGVGLCFWRGARAQDVPQSPAPPPKDAIVLFDGRDLSGWARRGSEQPAGWKIEDGAAVAGGGDIVTKQTFTDFQLHVEFNVPLMPNARGQARGNSGVYLQGRYEIQVLDSFGLVPQNGDCGAIYGQTPPMVNACRPPGQWQTYDILFHAPRFDDGGRRIEKARVSVLQNGIWIQDDVEIEGGTTASMNTDPRQPGPIMLQDHGNPVRYRNVWLRRLTGERPAARDARGQMPEPGFVSLFDGKTLAGWHVSDKTGHGGGGRWVVQDGAIVGSQDRPGSGGILITDAAYGDVEVALEMNNDFGPDSGLFLRSSEQGQAYQALIDYHPGGNLMGVYGEGLSGGIHVYNFELLDSPEKIRPHDAPFPLPVTPEQWPYLWHHGRWNELRARIAGNPPTITTWINGTKMMEWTDREKRHADRGGIALQVHGGGDFSHQFVRYRNIRVKRLD